MNELMNISSEVKELDIELQFGEVVVVTGESFCAQTEGFENEAIIIEERNGSFIIRDERKKRHLFNFNSNNTKDYVIRITIPETVIFDRVKINSGAAEVKVESLHTNILKLELGAGEVEFDVLEVSNYAKISGGAGELHVRSGSINDLQLSLGAGEVDMCAAVTGDSKLSAGVGELNLTLCGNPEDYSVTASKGIGACNIYGASVVNGNTYGAGTNRVQVSGGVGEINIRFQN